MSAPRLLADIGGTHARFALAAPGAPPGPATVLRVAEHPGPAGAIGAFLAGRRVSGAAIAAAGPVEAGPDGGARVRLTNAPWEIDTQALSAALGGAPVRLLNDVEAVALALAHLVPAEVETLLPGAPAPVPLPRLALNLGTGVGAAVAVPAGGGWTPLATEAGHMTLPAGEGAASVEDLVSGPGLAHLRAALGEGARAAYSAALGRVAGDLVLATGAWGGVFLCGGLAADWHRIVEAGAFRAAFTAKGPMTPRMAGVAVHRILHPAPALLGLAHADLAPGGPPGR